MGLIDGVRFQKAGKMGNLSRNFAAHEFACRCRSSGYRLAEGKFEGRDDRCTSADVDVAGELVDKLQAIRDILDIPIVIVSGIRCTEYNSFVGGKSTSAHISGRAVDILSPNTKHMWDLVKAAYTVGFKRIGANDYKRFVHLDVSRFLPQPRLWTYSGNLGGHRR